MIFAEKIDYEIKVKHQSNHVVVLEVEPIHEDLVIAAYGDGSIPSIIFQNQETREFTDVRFREFEGYKIWAADLNYDSLKVCLVNSSKFSL